jgi:hypothetical protein
MWSVKTWNRLNFITATIPEEDQDPHTISARWRHFVELLRQNYGKQVRLIRVLQIHPGGHGWHIHALCDQYIPASKILHFAAVACLGRMDFKMVSKSDRAEVVGYLSRYIARDLRNRTKAAKGVRMISASGHLRCVVRWWNRLSDITVVQDTPRLMKSLRVCCENLGMKLCGHISALTLFTSAPPEALAMWRETNPGYAF